MRRGEIWWANLPPPRGSEPGFKRPVVIVQDDEFNASRIGTVVVIALTTQLQRERDPGNLRLRKSTTNLPKASVANVSAILTMNKRDLLQRVSTLPADSMARIDAGLRLVLNL